MSTEPQVTGMSASDDKMTQEAVNELCDWTNKWASKGMSPQAVFNALAHGVANLVAAGCPLDRLKQRQTIQVFAENTDALVPLWQQLQFDRDNAAKRGEDAKNVTAAPRKSALILN